MAQIETILEALCAGQMSMSEAAAILEQAHGQAPMLASQRLEVIDAFLAAGRLSAETADQLKVVLTMPEPVDKRTLVRPPGATGGATGTPASPTGALSIGTGPAGSTMDSAPQQAYTGGTTGGVLSSWPPAAEPGTAPPVVEVGTVLRDRFLIQEVVGTGGMGVVFRALDRRREEAHDRHPHVALKVLGEDFKNHPDALVALQREARRMQQLSHPRIAAVYDFDRDGPHVYLVMELLEGESLDHVLSRHAGVGMEEKQALRIISGAGDALSFAHSRGVVHSDFKPANVFVMQSGEVKVFDFGIARIAKDSGQAGDAALTVFDAGKLGAMTNAYASPEQMLDTAAPDPRDDVYAFGLVVYELLAGKHPFDRKSAVEAQHRGMTVEPIPSLSERQNEVLAAALSFSREARLGDIKTLVHALSEPDVDRVGGQIIVPPRDGVAGRAASGSSVDESPGSRKGVMIAAAVGVIVALVGAYWYFKQPTEAPVGTTDVAAQPPAVPALVPESEEVAASVVTDAATDSGSPPVVAVEPPVAAEAVQAEAGAPETGAVAETTPAAIPEQPPEPAVRKPAPPAEPGLYRWVDSNGVAQFGENPPPEYAESAVKVMDLE